MSPPVATASERPTMAAIRAMSREDLERKYANQLLAYSYIEGEKEKLEKAARGHVKEKQAVELQRLAAAEEHRKERRKWEAKEARLKDGKRRWKEEAENLKKENDRLKRQKLQDDEDRKNENRITDQMDPAGKVCMNGASSKKSRTTNG